MISCTHCHKPVDYTLPFVESFSTGQAYHASCWSAAKGGDASLKEWQQVHLIVTGSRCHQCQKAQSVGNSAWMHISRKGARLYCVPCAAALHSPALPN